MDQVAIGGIIEDLDYGETIYKDNFPTRRTRAVVEAFVPVCQSIREYKELPETTQIELTGFAVGRKLVEPGQTSSSISRDWHGDGERSGEHRVVLATSMPTEIVLGKIGLSELARLHTEMIFSSGDDSYNRLGLYLGATADKKLLDLGLSIAQLLPYHAYLLEQQDCHRSPENPMTEPIDRGFFNLIFVEKPLIDLV
ncbi:MAG TPA: hypothetical protein VIH90_04590 [Candidatus Saccharimonadales bacterium]